MQDFASNLVPNYGRNIEAFAVDRQERHLFAGTVLGQLLTIEIDRFVVLRAEALCSGLILAVETHPELPYLACLGVDHTVTIMKYDADAQLQRIAQVDIRNIRAENDYTFSAHQSLSQALAFHPRERRLITRNGSGAVVELGFDDTQAEVRWCRGFSKTQDGEAYDLAYLRYLEESELIFCSDLNGDAMLIDPQVRDKPLIKYRYNHETLHAAEHVTGSTYLLPSDSRRVICFDMKRWEPLVVGPTIVRDHLERVDYNKVSGRAFIASFDRSVHEICPETCRSLRQVARVPFKCRWLKTLLRAPTTMLLQCRNGALYKLDLETHSLTGVIKETPNALWTSAAADGCITVYGDGSEALELRPSERANAGDPDAASFTARWVDLGYDPGFYTKRAVHHAPTGRHILARTDGTLWTHDARGPKLLTQLAAPLRDIAVAPEGFELFAVTEDGRAHKLDLETGRVTHTFASPSDEPFWSLAYNHQRRLLAVTEREGSLHILDADDLSSVREVEGLHKSKRAKWLNADQLLFGMRTELCRLDVSSGELELVIPNQGNTIEDFTWDDRGRYLVICTYHRDLSLFYLPTFEHLSSTTFDMHYPKGVLWLSQKGQIAARYPDEFIAYGRSGVARHYRVQGERIVTLGPLHRELSQVHPRAGVTLFESTSEPSLAR